MTSLNMSLETCVKIGQALEKDDLEAFSKIYTSSQVPVIDVDGNTLLHLACKVKAEKCVAKIVSDLNGVAMINAKNAEGKTPFYIAVAFAVSNTCLRQLIAAGAQPDLHPVGKESVLQIVIQCSLFPNLPSDIRTFEWLERVAVVMHGTLHSKTSYDLQLPSALECTRLPDVVVALCAGYVHTGMERLVQLISYAGGKRADPVLNTVYSFQSWEKNVGQGDWEGHLARLHSLFLLAPYAHCPGQLQAFDECVAKIKEDKDKALKK